MSGGKKNQLPEATDVPHNLPGSDVLPNASNGDAHPQAACPILGLLEFPFVEADRTKYLSRHLDAQFTMQQALAVRMFTNGLVASKERLLNGAPVDSTADAFRWLADKMIEQMAAAGVKF